MEVAILIISVLNTVLLVLLSAAVSKVASAVFFLAKAEGRRVVQSAKPPQND